MKVFADIENTFFSHFHEHLTYFRYYTTTKYWRDGRSEDIREWTWQKVNEAVKITEYSYTDANGMKFRS